LVITYLVDAVDDPEYNEVRLEVSGLSLESLKGLLKLNQPPNLPFGKVVSADPETYPESPEDVVSMLASLTRGPSLGEKFLAVSMAIL
jgi:hypothetical protein